MSDKLGRLAESVAANISRRAFLGGFGRGAVRVAGVVGALLASAAPAHAHPFCCCGAIIGCHKPSKGRCSPAESVCYGCC